MKFFKDKENREWKISITLDTVETLRESLKVDLLDPTGQSIERLGDDLFLLGRTLWMLCEKQADERKITPEQFAEAVAGDPFDSALLAVTEAVTDFFPQRKRLLLQRANGKFQTLREKAEQLAMAKLDDPKLEAKLMEAMEKRMAADLESALTRLNSAGNLPESSELILGP